MPPIFRMKKRWNYLDEISPRKFGQASSSSPDFMSGLLFYVRAMGLMQIPEMFRS